MYNNGFPIEPHCQTEAISQKPDLERGLRPRTGREWEREREREPVKSIPAGETRLAAATRAGV